MVAFTVHAPPVTPDWEPLFLAGDGPALGGWSPHAVRLDPGPDATHHARVDLPAGTTARFLVTRGRWRAAENDGHGHEVPPREVVVTGGDQDIEVRVAGWGRDAIHYHHNVRSDLLEHPRTVTVALPPGYDGRRRFPVFYLNDGQNLFDAATAFAGVAWGCDETAERVARQGLAQPVILVGVANTPDRLAEYGPPPAGSEAAADLARAYGRFLAEEVKPFIDRTYSTRPGPADTGIGGSSMGALAALHLAEWHPAVFGRCAALSPSLWWDRERFLRALPARAGWLGACRIWLDMGGREGLTDATRAANLRRSRRLARLLAKHGMVPGVGFHYLEVPDAEHNEWWWGDRFGQVLAFLFPTD